MTRGSGRKTRTSGTFGSVDKRATGYRARYVGPDGRRHQAPTLFLAKKDARAWLALRHAEIVKGQWMPPDATAKPAPKITFGPYANRWVATRTVKGRPLRPRTVAHYRGLLDDHLLPTFGALPVAAITIADVDAWYARTLTDAPTMRSHAYSLLRTILETARVGDRLVDVNPCVIRGAGSTSRVHKIRPATLDELAKLAEATPDRYRLMVLLGAWCAMRFGELAELRRRDADLDAGIIRVRRAVVRIGGRFEPGPPKSDAGVRDVHVPPHLLPALRAHMIDHAAAGADGLLFPAHHGGWLAPSTFNRWYYRARDAAGRPDLRFHDLRHTGAVLAAQTGATLAALMARLGHSTPGAALRYQHAAAGADAAIAEGLSKLAGG